MNASEFHPRVRHVAILLTPEFGLTSFTCIVEALRSANALGEASLYTWTLLGLTLEGVVSTAGLRVTPEGIAGTDEPFDIVFVPAAGNPTLVDDARINSWLRRLHRHGTVIAGVSGGAIVLAKAGLLNRRRFTVHWEHLQPMREAFPGLQPSMTLYEIDRGIATSAGGIATFDLMLTLIAQHHGPNLAARVGEWLLHTQPRDGGMQQRGDIRHRFGTSHPGLVRVLGHMERHHHRPLRVSELAVLAFMSSRHLGRLFRQKMGTSIHQHLNEIRLMQARVMLRQTRLAIPELAAVIGFPSSSHFARLYRHRFGHGPATERRLQDAPAAAQIANER